MDKNRGKSEKNRSQLLAVDRQARGARCVGDRYVTFQGMKSRGFVVGEGGSEFELPNSRAEPKLLSHITGHGIHVSILSSRNGLHEVVELLELKPGQSGEEKAGRLPF